MTQCQAHPRPSLRKRMQRELSRNGALFIMLLLPLAILILFKYIPMYGVQIAFRDYRPARGILGSDWVGLKNLQKFFTYYKFKEIFLNTLYINLYSLATFPLSLIFALLLNYLPFLRYKKTIQTVSYAPHFISTVVLCSMILQFMNARTGMFNAVLGVFGVPPVNYMAKSEYFYSIYVWSGVWQELGYSSIIYIAALSGISPELHEAAIVDGASIVKRMWYVDIPGVLPTLCILLIMRCGSLLNIGYEKILLLQNNLNKSVSEVISTYAYAVGINSGRPQYAYSAAVSLFTTVVNMVLLLSVNRISRLLSGNSLW